MTTNAPHSAIKGALFILQPLITPEALLSNVENI